MTQTSLEKRIEALEKVILKSPTTIASHAVDLLMAVPDEEAKISSMLRIVDSAKPEIKEKITAHIDEYDAFVTEAQESYAGILKETSPSMIFKVKYFKAKGDEKKLGQLLEETEGVDCDEYQEAVVAYSLEKKDKEKVKKMVERIKPEILLRVSPKIKAIADDELKYLTAKQLLKSEDSEILAEGINYAKEVKLDDKKGKVFMKKADELLEGRKNVKKAVALIDIVLKEEKDYEKLANTGRKLNEAKENGDKYFERALDASDSVNEQELEKTADYLLGARKYELAKEFYKKVLRDEEKWEKYRGIAQVLVKAGQKSGAKEILKMGAEWTRTLDEYLGLNEPVLNEHIKDIMEVMAIGLERFDKTSDYKKAVQWVEERYRRDSVVTFIDELKRKYSGKIAEKNIEFLDDYKVKIEKEMKEKEEKEKELRKKKEEAEKKTREEAWKRRQEDMEKELQKKKEQDERLQKLTEEIMEERRTKEYKKFDEKNDRYVIRDATIDGVVRDIQISKEKLEGGKSFDQDTWDKKTKNTEFKVPSLVDYTAIAIELYKNKNGPQKDLVERIRQMLKDDFENNYMMTSTTIEYSKEYTPDDKEKIKHNDKTEIKHAHIKGINHRIEVLNNDAETIINALFGIGKTKEEIKEVYKWLTGKTPYLYTLIKPEYGEKRAVVLGRYIVIDRFDINCIVIFDSRPARGVVVGTPKNTGKTSQNLAEDIAEEIIEEKQNKPAPISGITNLHKISQNLINNNDDQIIKDIINKENIDYIKKIYKKNHGKDINNINYKDFE